MNDIEIIPTKLWSTFLFEANFPDHDAISPEISQLIDNLIALQEFDVDSGVAPKAKKHLKESNFQFLENEDQYIQCLHYFLNELIKTVAYEVNHLYWPEDVQVHCYIIESWYHVTANGGFHDIHSHPNCSWCGIYFLDEGESNLENGQNRFYDPRNNADHYQDAGTAYLNANGVWDVAPRAGQVVIFPSYLKHSAMTYFGSQNRKVIAFNAQIEIE